MMIQIKSIEKLQLILKVIFNVCFSLGPEFCDFLIHYFLADETNDKNLKLLNLKSNIVFDITFLLRTNELKDLRIT